MITRWWKWSCEAPCKWCPAESRHESSTIALPWGQTPSRAAVKRLDEVVTEENRREVGGAKHSGGRKHAGVRDAAGDVLGVQAPINIERRGERRDRNGAAELDLLANAKGPAVRERTTGPFVFGSTSAN